jgi:hypothetical protein
MQSSGLGAKLSASLRPLSSVSMSRVHQPRTPNSINAKSSDSLSSFFSELRIRAVLALTASLAQDQRQNLLSSMGALDKSTAEQQKRSSVGEAVAQALAQEAAKRGTLIEQEEEKIAKRVQKAMEERMMNDLVVEGRKLALERWRNELKEEVEGIEHPQNAHPILGPVLFDLGYKRLYITSAKVLSTIPIWSQQRSYRHDRAKVMASDKMKSLELGFPGVISLHEVRILIHKIEYMWKYSL